MGVGAKGAAALGGRVYGASKSILKKILSFALSIFYILILIFLPILLPLLLPLALQPAVGFGLSSNILPFFFYPSPTRSIIVKSIQLFLCSTFVTISFLLCGVVSPTPNPQHVGPGYPFLSGSSPLTCLEWEALPVA
jgi:hypothetical protein